MVLSSPCPSPLNGSIIPLFVTPAIFKPGSTVLKNVDSRLKISGMTEKYYKGALPPHNPRKKLKHGCLIKDFRHDGRRGSLLNASITFCFVTPAIFKPLLACP